jgi:hypothetical protein
MKFYNIILPTLFLSIFFISCSTDSTDEILIDSNLEEKTGFILKSKEKTIIHKDGTNEIYEDGVLSMIYTIENNKFTKSLKTKSSNQYSFYNENLDKTFLLNNIKLVDDYTFKFDLIVDGELRIEGLTFESEIRVIEMDKSCPLCPLLAPYVADAIEAITDAFETSEEESTCRTAIDACSANGGFPNVTRNENGCQVQCDQPDE